MSPGAPPRPAAPLTPDFADDIALPPAPAIARPPATGSAEDIPRPLAPAIARPPAADLVDDAPPPSAPKSPPRRHALVVAATVVGGRGLDTVLTGLEIAGRRELRRRLDLGADVMSVLTPTWQAQPRGSILFGLTTARVTLTLRLPLGARTSLLLSGGGGLALGWAVGRAAPPYRGTADTRPGGVLSAALALATRLGPRTSLHAGAALDVLMPSLKVRTTGIEIATLGAPLLRGVLGLSWDWLLPARPRR